SDIFVFPSQFEGLGISLVEAAACGLACIGSRTGGIVDVIEHGRSGLLTEPGDVAGLTDAILRLARDPGARAALGAEARAGASTKSPPRRRTGRSSASSRAREARAHGSDGLHGRPAAGRAPGARRQ